MQYTISYDVGSSMYYVLGPEQCTAPVECTHTFTRWNFMNCLSNTHTRTPSLHVYWLEMLDFPELKMSGGSLESPTFDRWRCIACRFLFFLPKLSIFSGISTFGFCVAFSLKFHHFCFSSSSSLTITNHCRIPCKIFLKFFSRIFFFAAHFPDVSVRRDQQMTASTSFVD